MTPLLRMILGALLTFLFTEGCFGQTENCRHWNYSHIITCHCDSRTLVLLPCPVCNPIDSTEVTWCYSQTEISTSELNITAGARCTLKESGNHINNANCSDLNLYRYELKFYANCSSYVYHIVTPLELSKHCAVQESTRNATVCDSLACTYGQSKTGSQCVAQITTTPVLPSTTLSTQNNSTGLAGAVSEPTTPVLPSTTLSAQSNSTGLPGAVSEPTTPVLPSTTLSAQSNSTGLPGAVSEPTPPVLPSTTPVLPSTTLSAQSNSTGLAGAASGPTPISVPSSIASPSNARADATSKPTPSVPSSTNAPDCMLGGVSCHIVYLAVGLGALVVIVVLLVVVVIVLVCISVKRGKTKMQGAEKVPEEELHTYAVVAQPMGGETVPNDQQHISHRTQHTTHVVDKTQQTHGEYHLENTTGQEYERLQNTRQRSRREEARSRKHDYEQVSTGEQNESETLPSHENLYRVLEGPIEVSSSRALTTTTADMYSTPNISSKGQPQSPGSQDHFYHVLEGPTPPTGTNTYTSAIRSTAPGKKEDDSDYDEPVLLTVNKAGHQLFDDPKYQSTFAPVMSTQSDTLPQNRAKIKLLPNLACASPVEEAAISDSSFQASAVTSPANPTEGKWNDMHAFWKGAQEDDYNQPAVITIKNKDLINERGDQTVLFDDPTYQVASAPV